MQLASLRDRILSRVKRALSTFTPTEIDYAIMSALNELDLMDYWYLTYSTLATMTALNPNVDISGLVPDTNSDYTAGIRPERVIRTELAFNQRGTWSDAGVSYAKNDMVEWTGTAEQLFYECITANTSGAGNEPGTVGGEAYWTARKWNHGDVIDVINRDRLAQMLGDRSYANPWVPLDYVFQDPQLTPGKPRAGAFLTQDTFLVFPVPDVAYKMRFLIQYPLTEWEPGDSEAVSIEIPDNILVPAIDGMCYYLEPDHPMNGQWKANFDRHISRVQGMTIVDAGTPIRNPAAYLDHTDGLLGRVPYRGGYNNY